MKILVLSGSPRPNGLNEGDLSGSFGGGDDCAGIPGVLSQL